MEKPYYINRKNNCIQLQITYHALKRFCERWVCLYNTPVPENACEFITQKFLKSSRVININKFERKRLKRYGKDTIFFRNSDFTFVVYNKAIVTIEISRKEKRQLNKLSSNNVYKKKEENFIKNTVIHKSQPESRCFIYAHFNDSDGNQKTKQVLNIKADEYAQKISKVLEDNLLDEELQSAYSVKNINSDSVWSISFQLGRKGKRKYFDWQNNSICTNEIT